MAVLAGSLLGGAVVGAAPGDPLVIDRLVTQPIQELEELPALRVDFEELLRVTDPPDDVIHSTGAAAGYAPGFNEFTEFQMGRIQIDADPSAAPQLSAFGATQSSGGFWCAEMGFGGDPGLHTACPPDSTPNGFLAPGSDALYVEWQLQGELPLVPGGRCEFVLWGFDPTYGPAFGPIADPNPFPFDPALGTNMAVGMGINPDGSRGTFALMHPGEGGFGNAETHARFAWIGDKVAGIIPGEEVAGWTDIRPYTFCTGEGFDYSPEGSGGDSTELLPFAYSGLPGIVLQAAPAPVPTTTTTTTTSTSTTTTTIVEEESSPPTSIVETDPETGTSYIGWWIAGGLILFVGGGVYFVARPSNPCIPLKGRWMQAKKACEEAQRRADERRASLREAQQGLQDALDQMREQDAKADAQREQLAQMQRAKRSSIESGGVTFHRIPEGLLTSDGLDSIIESLEQAIASHEAAIQSWKDSVDGWKKIVEDHEQHVAEAEAEAKEKCAAAAAAKKAYEDCIKAASAPAPAPAGAGPAPEPGGGSGTPTPPPTEGGSGGGTAPGGGGPGVSTGGDPEPEPETQPSCEEGQTQQEETGRQSFTVPASTGSLVISIEPPTEEFAEWMAGEMAGAGGWFSPSHLNDPGLAGAVRDTLRGLDSGMSVSHTVRIEVPRREITYACIQHWVCRSGRWVESHTERREVGRKDLAPIVIEESGKTDSNRVAQLIVQAQRQYQRLVRADESISQFCPGG